MSISPWNLLYRLKIAQTLLPHTHTHLYTHRPSKSAYSFATGGQFVLLSGPCGLRLVDPSINLTP